MTNDGFIIQKLIGAFLAAGCFFLGANGIAQAQSNSTFRLGIMETHFLDMAETSKRTYLQTLNSMMNQRANVPCYSVMLRDPLELGKQLDAGKVQLGMMTGYEYAWAKAKYPKLLPLVISVIRYPFPTAYLVSRNDSTAKEFADLRGKLISLPMRTRPHVRLFLEREGDAKRNGFRITRHDNIEEGIDDVVRGKVAGCMVDQAALYSYRLLKPGAWKRLKVVERSPTFPAGVVVYREGGVDAGTLNRFRQGLLTADQNAKSQQMMRLFRLTSFEAVPAQFESVAAAIRKVYPSP